MEKITTKQHKILKQISYMKNSKIVILFWNNSEITNFICILVNANEYLMIHFRKINCYLLIKNADSLK